MTPKRRSLRNFRNPIACLILLAAFGAAAGCSNSNTSGDGGGVIVNHVDASGNSIPGWLTPTGGLHAKSATLDYIANGGRSGCTECHGSDLSGGISKVSCFGNPAGCHHSPVADWATPAVHGAAAKKAPGSSGFASCQICHGADFRTPRGTANRTCYSCHTLTPHAPAPWRGSPYTHTNTDPANAPVCVQCHYPNSPNNPANHPATPAPTGTPPGCFNNTLCHGEVGHPAGWVAAPPSAPQPHGVAAKAANGFPGCQTCHGTGFTGSASSGNVSCFQATWNGFNCHNGGAVASWPHAPPPWRTSAGSVHTHTNTDNTGSPGNPVVCAECHQSNPGTPGCFNNTLCHGVVGHLVPFNDPVHYSVTSATFAGSCGACHDIAAPSTKSGPVCRTCHVAASPLTALTCTSCHASPPTGGAPAGAAYPNIAGAHSTHIALTTAGTPISCDTCHNGLGPSLLNLEHYNRAKSRVTPGDVSFLATYNAQSGPSSFDNSAALSCSNVSCHGGKTTPNWQTGSITVNTQCTSCHTTVTTTQFNGPSSVTHNVGDHQVTCTICHNTTALAVNHFTNLGTPALEGPASATIGGAGTAIQSWDPVTKSCDPTCHGARTWR